MDKLQICSGIVCAAYHAADGRNIDIEHFLTKETELICGLTRGDGKWGRCDYLLHIIFWTLRDKDCSKILAKISKENIDALKAAITVAVARQRPDKDAADKISNEHKNKSLNPTLPMHEKYKNNIIRFSALIDSKVADKWNACVKELSKWEQTINGKGNEMQTSNAKEQTVSAAKPIKPVAVQTPEKPVETQTDNSELWTTEQLAAAMGFKAVHSLLKAKYKFLKRHPAAREQFDELFVVSPKGKKRLLFKSDRLDDLNRLMNRKQTTQKNATAQSTMRPALDNNLWDIKKLTQELGISVNTFYCKKSTFLKKHPAAREQFNKWFVTPSKKDNRLLFDSKYFEELKALFNTDKAQKNQIEPSGVKPVQKVLAIEHPSDLVDIKGLEAYLAQLTNLCNQVNNEKNAAQASYDDLQRKAKLEQEKVENATKRIASIQSAITTVDGLLKEYDKAKEDLKTAEEKLNQKQTEINNFLLQRNNLLAK